MVRLGELRSYKDLSKALKKYNSLNLLFCDVPGTWQHFNVPRNEARETLASRNGKPRFGFDASSIRGFQSIHESDMVIEPVPGATFTNPFTERPTLSSICNIHDPGTRKDYVRDPRLVARRAEEYLRDKFDKDTVANFGPELEFHIFDGIRYNQNAHEGYYHIESDEGIWNSGKDGKNLGHKPRYKQGYFPVPPTDSFQDLRDEIVENLENIGFRIEKHHHEVGTAGEAEIDFRFDRLVDCGDKVLIYKFVVKNTARKHDKTVTFMPKPIYGDNGNGMHTHFSIWRGKRNLFAGKKYAGLSDEALWAIGGILKHTSAIVAFTSPTTNSYKRLVPGYEAPVNLSYSRRNRSAGIRIPVYDLSKNTRRLEVRFPDPSCNPYYAFSAILMAGLDGIERKIDPGKPMDFDQYESGKKDIPTTPITLEEALNNLERDHEFLLDGKAFTEDIIKNWIDYKRKEIGHIGLIPTPAEFAFYFDA